jgi:hypothetical protein
MLGIGPAAWYTGLTTWPFIIDSTILHLWLIWNSWQFYKDNSNVSARKTFKMTLYYLPIFIILMLIHLTYWGQDDEDEEQKKKILAASAEEEATGTEKPGENATSNPDKSIVKSVS